MRIEGKTTITLTDIHTGERKIYEHKNELTDFATEYFRECGALNWNPLGSISASYPLDDLFGGIMCLRAPITSNSAQYPTRKPLYVPAGNAMTANACIDNAANSPQGVTELGQYTAAESSSGTESRVYTYDWDTYEGVGDISCICLTTRAGGYIGAGNATSDKADVTLLQRYWSAYPGSVNSARTIDNDTRSRLCALSIGDAQVGTITTTAAQALQSGTVTINWYDSPISKLNPFENINTFKDYTEPGGVKTLNTPRRSETHTFTAAAGVTAARVMGGTGYILLVGANGNTIQNGATVYARQILKDGTIVPFSATIAGLPAAANIPLNDTQFIGGEIINGALYLAYASINGTNSTIRVKIASDGAATDYTITGAGRLDCDRVFFNQEGRIYLGGLSTTSETQIGSRYLDTTTGAVTMSNARGWNSNPGSYGYAAGFWQTYDSPCLFCVCGRITGGGPTVSPLAIIRPPCNWLSTINNLENTITKTGTQTMKIQYTLTLYRAPNP